MHETMTVCLDDDMGAQLDELAHATSQTKSNLIIEALKQYLLVNVWQTEAIREGIRQADAGELIAHEDIREKWVTKLAHTMD
jgi:RHH-type rel operon transcriptional repressor/antitoxin RelB